MLNIYIGIIVFVFLIIVSIVDIKKPKGIPSLLTTGGLFFVALVSLKNVEYGILGAIFGWLLSDFILNDNDYFSGLADLKMTILLGLLVSSLYAFLLYMIILVCVGFGYKLILQKIVKKNTQIAFTPVFLVCYLIMILLEVGFNVKIF